MYSGRLNSELKHKTNGWHPSVFGPHGFSCPTRELEIEMNYVQYCYSSSSLVVVTIFLVFVFTGPTDPIFLLENDCKHKNKWGRPNIVRRRKDLEQHTKQFAKTSEKAFKIALRFFKMKTYILYTQKYTHNFKLYRPLWCRWNKSQTSNWSSV